MFHAAEYIKMINNNADGGTIGLGFMSEHAMEAMHANVKSKWEKVKPGPQHSDYDKRLTEFIVAFKSQNS